MTLIEVISALLPAKKHPACLDITLLHKYQDVYISDVRWKRRTVYIIGHKYQYSLIFYNFYQILEIY